MHYYKKDIAKYYKKAGRLTMLQHGAYTMLMDACYDREIFPTLEQAIDWCWATTEEEIKAIKFVLSKFFTEIDGVYSQAHISEVLEKYHETAAVNKAIALKREAKKRQSKEEAMSDESTERARSVDESTTNEHLINNYKLQTTNYELGINKNNMPDKSDIPPDQKTKRSQQFKPPEISEIEAYCRERKNSINPNSFFDHYEANGWMRGKTKIKDWKACIRTWEKNTIGFDGGKNKTQHQINQEGIARSLGLIPKHDEFQGETYEGTVTKQLD